MLLPRSIHVLEAQAFLLETRVEAREIFAVDTQTEAECQRTFFYSLSYFVSNGWSLKAASVADCVFPKAGIQV